MRMRSFTKSVTALAAALFLAMSGPVLADYPERSIRIVVPYPAGGATDTRARQIAQGLS